MSAADVAFFQERLELKEQELGELKSAFHKYKLKQKVKYDSLKKDVHAYCRNTGQVANERENVALLQIKVAEMETELEEARAHSENLYEELNKRQVQLSDQMIVIRNLENSLKEVSPSREGRAGSKEKNSAQVVDMERIQQQMLYKDQRIIELNNSILEKERQILDLQEMCREQGEVADAKKQAMRLVQKRFEALESINHREIGTETDPWFPTRERDHHRGGRGGAVSRSLSPGHAVVSRAAGGSSPPPLDPQDAENNLSNRLEFEDDMLPGTSSGFQGRNLDEEITLRRKEKKRVTFDLPPSLAASSLNLNDVDYGSLQETITRLTEENSKLMADVEHKNAALMEARRQLEESENERASLLRDTKNSNLKARAVAHSRIRELEGTLAELNEKSVTEMAYLQTECETLRSTREWEVEQNGLLREQLNKLREKNTKLTAELDQTGGLNRELERKLDESREMTEALTVELEEAEELACFLEDQKEGILDDVEKMKEAIFAQDQFIDLLEADIVIYEEHVGLLRESLGASKIDHRSLLRSKAFEMKLKALEQEKEQINQKSREEKLKTKALVQKVKLLEEANEQLVEKLCEKEMGVADDAEMVETCRELEKKLRESEEKFQMDRAGFEMELATQQIENKQRLVENEELRARIYQLEDRIRQEQQGPSRRGPEERNYDQNSFQTQLLPQQAGISEQETQKLREKVEQQEARIGELVRNLSCLETELDVMRGTNFELQDRAKEADELEKDYDNLVEKHRETCMELVSTKETLEKLQETAAEVEQLTERATTAEEEVKLLRLELNDARLNYSETVACKKELETIKAELEREKAVSQGRWNEVLRKALDSPSEPGSRKSSMEVQNQQYIIAFEEKIDKLGEDLQEVTAKLAQSEIEKQELRLILDRVQEMEHVKSSAGSHQLQSFSEKNKELEEMVKNYKAKEVKYLAKIHDLELESGLAGELSVEMGRVIQQFEKQMQGQEIDFNKANEKAHSSEMELRLHEMLNEELGTQLDDLKQKEKLLEEIVDQLEQSKLKGQELESQVQEVTAALEGKTIELEATKKKNYLLVQQIQELEEKLTTSVKQTSEVKVELEEKKETVEKVHCALKEIKQEQGEQEIQRVVQQSVQNLPPQNAGAWNWGQAGYSQQYYEQTGQQQPQLDSQQRQEHRHSHRQQQHYHNHPYGHEYPGLPQLDSQMHQQPYPQLQQRQPQLDSQQLQQQGYDHSYHLQHPMEPQQHNYNQPQLDSQLQQHHHGHDHYATHHQQQLNSQPQGYDHSHHLQHPMQPQPPQLDSQEVTVPQHHSRHGHHHHHDSHVHFAEPVITASRSPPDYREEVQMSPVAEDTVVTVLPEGRGPCTEHYHDRHAASQHSQATGGQWISEEQLQTENEILRQCVNDTIQLREDTSSDMERLRKLNEDLEILADTLKGELWTLNGRLKASILDRENLEDRVIELDNSLAEEKKKVASLDVELSEQQEMIEKATRQAAEAENESNRRLAECLEMESKRIELEQAYTQLTEYYNQLQAAYNLLYAQQQQNPSQEGGIQQTGADSALLIAVDNILEVLGLEMKEEDLRVKLQAIEQKIREKLQEVQQLHTAVSEQNRVARALEARLEVFEDQENTTGGEKLELKNKVDQLEGDLEWKQEECDSLRRQVDELQHALNQVIINEGDDSARLSTRQADVDSLFRTNAELAHTNVRLQNELDERQEQEEVTADGDNSEAQVLAARVRELEQEKAESTERISFLEKKEKELNRRILSLQDELEELEEFAIDKEKLQVLENANLAVITEIEELRAERDTLRANIEIIQRDHEVRREEAIQKQSAVVLQSEKEQEKDLKAIMEEKERLEARNRELEEEVAFLVEASQKKEETWDGWEEKAPEEDIETLKRRLEEKNQEQEDLKLRNLDLEEELATLQSKLLERDGQNTSEEVEELKIRLETVQEEQEDLKLRNQDLEEELSALVEAKSKQEAVLKELEDLKARNHVLEDENATLRENPEKEVGWGEDWEEKPKEDLEKLQEELNSLRDLLDERQQVQEDLKLRNMELEEVLTRLQEANRRLQDREIDSDWNQEAKDNSEELETLKNDLEKNQEEKKDLKEEIRKLKKEIEALKAEGEENREKCAELEAELVDLQEKYQELALNNKELEERIQNLGKREEESTGWGDDWNENPAGNSEQLEKELEDLKNQLDEVQNEKEDLKLKNIQLVEELQNFITKKHEPEEENWGDGWNSQPGGDELEVVTEEKMEKKVENQEEAAWGGDWDPEPIGSKENIHEKLEELQNEMEKANSELEDVKLRNLQLEEELVVLQGKLQEKEGQNSGTEVQELKMRLETVQEEQEDLKLRNQDLEEELSTHLIAKAKQEMVLKELEYLKTRNQDLEEEVADLKSKTQKEEESPWGDDWNDEKSSENIEELKASLQEKEIKLQEALEELNDAKDDFEERNQKIEELEDELKLLKQKEQELDQLRLESEIMRTKILELEAAAPRKQHRRSQDWSQNEVEQLKHEIEERDKERSKLEAVITRVEKENEDLMGQLDQVSLEGRERQDDDFTQNIVALQQEVLHLREQNSRLQLETAKNQTKTEETWGDDWSQQENLPETFQKHGEELEKAQSELAALTSTLQSVENSLLETREEAQRRQSELENRIQSLEEAKKEEEEEHKTKKERIEALEKRLDQVEKQNNLLKESEGRLLESVDEFGALADNKQEEVSRLQTVVNQLEKERQTLLEALETEKSTKSAAEEDPALRNELEVLKTERNSLKSKLSSLEARLYEVEKEKNQIKTSYENLKAKIQARRAAAAGNTSNASSRAPSRASAVSIGEIREDPVELSYQQLENAPTFVYNIPTATTNKSQDIDNRVQKFVNDVKLFLSRVESSCTIQTSNFSLIDQSLENLMSSTFSSSETVAPGPQASDLPVEPEKSEDFTVETLKKRIKELESELEEQKANFSLLEEIHKIQKENENLLQAEETEWEDLKQQLEEIIELRSMELETKSRMVEELVIQNVELEEKLAAEQENSKEKNAEIGAVNKILDALSQENETLEQKLLLSAQRIQKLVAEQEKVENQEEELKSRNQKLEEELKILKGSEIDQAELLHQVEELKKLLLDAEKTINSSQVHKEAAWDGWDEQREPENFKDPLQEEVAQLQSVNFHLQEELQVLKTRESLRNEVQDLQEEVFLLKNSLLDQLEVQELTERIQKLEIELANARKNEKSKEKEVKDHVEELGPWQVELERVREERNQLKYLVSRLEQDYEAQAVEIESLVAKTEDLEEEKNKSLEELQSQMETLKNQLDFAQNELEDLKLSNFEKEEELEALRDRESLRNEVDNLNIQIEVLKNSVEVSESGEVMKNHDKLDLKAIMEEKERLEARNRELEEEVAFLVEASQKKEETWDGWEEKAPEEDIETLKRRLEEKNQEQEDLKLRNLDLEEELATLHKKERENSQEEIQELKNRLEAVQEEQEGLKLINWDLEERIKELEEELEAKEDQEMKVVKGDQPEAVEIQLEALQGAENDEKSENQLEEVQKEVEQLKNRNSSLEKEVGELLAENKLIQERLEDVQDEKETSFEDFHQKEEEFNQRISQLEEKLISEEKKAATALETMEKELEQTIAEENAQKIRINSLENALESFKTDYSALKTRNLLLEKAVEDNDEVMRAYAEQEEKIAELETILGQKMTELEAVTLQKVENEQEIDRLVEALAACQMQLEVSNVKIRELEALKSRIEDERVQNALEEENSLGILKELRENEKNLEKTLEKEKAELEVFKRQKEEKQQEIDRLIEVLNSTQIQLEQSNIRISELETITSRSESLLVQRAEEAEIHAKTLEKVKRQSEKFEDEKKALLQLFEDSQLKLQEEIQRRLEKEAEEARKKAENEEKQVQTEIEDGNDVGNQTEAEEAFSGSIEPVLKLINLQQDEQSAPRPIEGPSNSTDIRISMEEGKKEEDEVSESVENDSADTEPLLPEFVIDQVRNSHFVYAGAPITQPLIRQLRALWGRRPLRPYFRYLLVVYFVFVHFLVFSSWFNPC